MFYKQWHCHTSMMSGGNGTTISSGKEILYPRIVNVINNLNLNKRNIITVIHALNANYGLRISLRL